MERGDDRKDACIRGLKGNLRSIDAMATTTQKKNNNKQTVGLEGKTATLTWIRKLAIQLQGVSPTFDCVEIIAIKTGRQ